MSKQNLIDNVIKKYSGIKHTIISRKYKEVNYIFDKQNNAPSLKDCINSYNYNKYININFAIYANLAEKLYKNYILEIANFIDSIKKNPTPEEIMYIYCYLLYNGYLSRNNSFKFLFPEKELNIRLALSVIYGQGVCRNVGTFLDDLLKAYNIESYGIITDRSSHDNPHYSISRYYKKLTELYQDEFEIQAEEFYSKTKITTGDHYEVLVYDGTWKLLDPSLCVSYKIIKNETEFKVLDYLKLWSLYAYDKCNINKTVKLYNLFKDKYMEADESSKNIKTQQNCYELCENNKQKIKKFHKLNEGYIDILGNSIMDL